MPSNIANAYIGNTPLKAIYVGDKKVYPNAEPFHAQFDLSKGASSTTLTLPFTTASSYANLTIDWGDGVTTTGTNTHTYASVGVYDVKVYGEMRNFRYNNTNQPQKLMRIINWGEFVISQSGVFHGCSNLVIDDLTNVPLVATTDMTSMFNGCASLASIPLLDTSSAVLMIFMFIGCTNLTSIPLLNTSKVTNMGSMFNGCTSLTTIPLLNTSKVTNMNSMFNGCASLTTIPLLNTSKVTNMGSMFTSCKNLTSIPLLDTSSATDMNFMFAGCASLTTIPLLNTSKVTNIRYMFNFCSNLTSIPLLNTSKVTDMAGMFQNCTVLNVNLSELCVPLITSLPNNFVAGAPLMTAEKLPVWGTCPNGENLLP